MKAVEGVGLPAKREAGHCPSRPLRQQRSRTRLQRELEDRPVSLVAERRQIGRGWSKRDVMMFGWAKISLTKESQAPNAS